MRLLYINPNSTEAMTDSIVTAARNALPEAEIIGWTNHAGPPAIQGAADGKAAVPGLMALLPKARAAGVDALVIACFDDTGLAEVRAAAHCPVVGIGQAAFHMAALFGQRFAVVTTLPVSVPVIEGNIAAYGFGRACVAVRPSGLGVLEVEAGGPAVLARLGSEISAAARDGAGAVVLGCAGMALHRDKLTLASGPVLIDGVEASALLAAAAVRYGAGSLAA
ncbi:aspartate/glutamate racemase family protein [Pseudoruegeria sp. HB172150]|uniref:aspartate/glutamate racemase family protein n=1 Tax=Pseudoruegeria sp. HB172150 TaxID=2721164 RepID=UPI0015540B2E|nr:aspartate/glutamate racemase family protein [Pseudoruegeria sp. HB172150]